METGRPKPLTVISPLSRHMMRSLISEKGEITVKGFGRPVSIYEVVDFRRDMGPNRSFLEHERSGFAMYLDSEKITERERESILSALEDAAERLRQEEDS